MQVCQSNSGKSVTHSPWSVVIETLDFPRRCHKPRPILETPRLRHCCPGTLVQLDGPPSLARPQGGEQQANCSPINCCLNEDTQRNRSCWRRRQNSPSQSSPAIHTTADGPSAGRLPAVRKLLGESGGGSCQLEA